jgi:serine/threonine protein kinase
MRLAEGPSPITLADDTPAAGAGTRAAQFGDYELIGQIGRGGMGVVYQARQLSLNRIVALKMIVGGDLASLASVRRFQVEAEAAAKLAHPNIVAIYEFGEREGLPFFSMQRIDGTSLDREMSALALPSFESTAGKSAHKTASRDVQVRIATLVVTVARALHHAHKQGVIHCDLKPSNILMDGGGEPHLTDFGIAHFLDREGQLTKSGVIGTPRYMAPEQAAGRRGDMTAATDIYGLGVILYELLTGRSPFVAATPNEMLRQVIEQEPAAPHELNSSVHRDLSIICLKCLEKNPRHRYASAGELGDDLERWIRHEPVLARRASSNERFIRWCQRKPAIATLAGFVALLLMTVAIGSALFAWSLSEKEKKRRTAENEREAALQTRETAVNLWRAELNKELDELWEHPEKPSVEITSEKRSVLMGHHTDFAYPGTEVRLRFGVYTFKKPSEMAKEFAPLLTALEEAAAHRLRRPVRIDGIIYRSYTNGHEGLLSGEVDFMRVGPASYVLMKKKLPGISLLAADVDPIQCGIFIRADSGITNLSQLRGKAFAFGDPESTFGTFLAKVALFRAGLRASDLSPGSRHFRSHDEVATAIKSNVCAAGSVNIEAIQKKDWQSRELSGFTNVLRFPYAAKAGIDPLVADGLKAALIAQKKFSEVLDEEYEALREDMKEALQFDNLKN